MSDAAGLGTFAEALAQAEAPLRSGDFGKVLRKLREWPGNFEPWDYERLKREDPDRVLATLERLLETNRFRPSVSEVVQALVADRPAPARKPKPMCACGHSFGRHDVVAAGNFDTSTSNADGTGYETVKGSDTPPPCLECDCEGFRWT